MQSINNLGNFLNYLRNKRITPLQLEEVRNELLEESTANTSYTVLIFSSCIIATLGLLSNNAAVIIGAMIIAPLMLPIRGVAIWSFRRQYSFIS